MPWTAPSAKEISQRMRASARAEIPGTDPFIWPNNLYVLFKVIAQMMRAFYLRLEWAHKQARPLTADVEVLEGFGADLGITRNDATMAGGTVTITATAGTILVDGARLLRSDGQAYDLRLEAPTVTTVDDDTDVQVQAEVAGKVGNTEVGTALNFETPVAGVSAVVVGSSGLTGGAEIENDASLRARILDRKRNPPAGGSPAEYRRWAGEVLGVTRVFVMRATPAAGSVTVIFMMDGSSDTGIPTAGDVANVQAKLEEIAPSQVKVIAQAPTPVPIDVTIASLAPDTAAVRSEIKKELLAMFQRRAVPATGTTSQKFSKSWIAEAISAASGESSHVLQEPTDDVVCDGDGEIAVLGVLSFA